jgi:hypothetical protein
MIEFIFWKQKINLFKEKDPKNEIESLRNEIAQLKERARNTEQTQNRKHGTGNRLGTGLTWSFFVTQNPKTPNKQSYYLYMHFLFSAIIEVLISIISTL